jgi:hypothetical protein
VERNEVSVSILFKVQRLSKVGRKNYLYTCTVFIRSLQTCKHSCVYLKDEFYFCMASVGRSVVQEESV